MNVGDTRAAAFTRLFEAVREGAFIGSVRLDAAGGGTTLAANPYLKAMFGYAGDTPDARVLPFAPDRFADPEDRSAFFARLESEGAVDGYLLRMRRLDGSPVWAEVTAQAETRRARLHIEALIRDVSERKRLDDESRDLYQQLLQAEKMAALGQTISGVAHELNNPLATILSWAERLADKTTDPAARRGVDVILGEADRAARIVRNLLTFARKRQSTRTMIDVNQVVADTLSLRAYEHRATNVAVDTALASGLPQVFADPHQLQQVLLNLVINAEQAMLSANGRGSLVIRTWHNSDDDAVVIEVNDDGPGVPVDMRTKIFDPFFTTKSMGRGLGLAAVHGIVRSQHGAVQVSSGPGKGTTFRVLLPVGGPASPAPSAGPAVAAWRGNGMVLVVDDEPIVRDAAQRMLEQIGFSVLAASDGEEAVRLYSRHQEEIACVLLDLTMPKMSGEETFRELRKVRPEVRVVLSSGYSEESAREQFAGLELAGFIQKPYEFETVAAVFRSAVSKSPRVP